MKTRTGIMMTAFTAMVATGAWAGGVESVDRYQALLASPGAVPVGVSHAGGAGAPVRAAGDPAAVPALSGYSWAGGSAQVAALGGYAWAGQAAQVHDLGGYSWVSQAAQVESLGGYAWAGEAAQVESLGGYSWVGDAPQVEALGGYVWAGSDFREDLR